MKQPKVFALIDCNNFFVSCERVFRPDLWDKPVAVLSNNDGCFVARSQEVKALGIPMGAPLFKWRREVDRAGVTLFSANFMLYGDFSQRVATLISESAPKVEAYSVDESFVELSNVAIESYQEWAEALQARIRRWVGIPVSIGVAPTKTLAKAAVTHAKRTPETKGILVVDDPKARERLLSQLAVDDIWGIGWRSAPKLKERGVATALDFARLDPKWVQRSLTIRGAETQAELLGTATIAIDDHPEPQKTLGRGRTFGHAVRSYHELESAVAGFTASAAVRLRRKGEVARGVSTYIRTSKHAETQRSVSEVVWLNEATSDTGQLIRAALEGLSRAYDPDFGYRKAEITLLGLVPVGETQAHLFTRDTTAERERMYAVDFLQKRYGERVVRHATELLGQGSWQSLHERRSPNYTSNWQQLATVKAL